MHWLTKLWIFALPLLFLTCSSHYSLKEPTKIPSPSTGKAQALIDQGMAAYDEGRYQAAIDLYRQVLANEPDNVSALYELAMAYSAMQQHDKSLELCLQAVQYQWPGLNRVYVLTGTELDYLGKPDDAIAVYEQGIKQYPNDLLLHYNLGVTQLSQHHFDDAKAALETAAILRPTHPSSHLALGHAFLEEGNKIPALFALARFLTLEPLSDRANTAREMLKSILFGNVRKDPAKAHQINITVSPVQPTSEGDFSSLSLMLALSSARQVGESQKGKTETDRYTEIFELLFSAARNSAEQQRRPQFVWQYYVPYFAELNNRAYVRAFVEHAIVRTPEPSDTVTNFLRWSEDYTWPKTNR